MSRKNRAGLLLGWRDKGCKQYYCNSEDTHSLLGMGDEEHNRRLLERRLHARPVHPSRVRYWDICDFWIRQARVASKG